MFFGDTVAVLYEIKMQSNYLTYDVIFLFSVTKRNIQIKSQTRIMTMMRNGYGVSSSFEILPVAKANLHIGVQIFESLRVKEYHLSG